MRVLVNLIPVRSGGGQQQALHFVNWLMRQDVAFRGNWLILVGRGSFLHEYLLSSSGLAWDAFDYSYMKRAWFEIFCSRGVIKRNSIDVVIHFAGAWIGIPVPQVVRSVYSNLFYPDVKFWPTRPLRVYLVKRLIDFVRLRGTLRADGIIFENRAMQRRATDLFGYPSGRGRYIAPSVGDMVEGVDKRCADNEFRVLYLTSWHLNKNVHLLPAVASRLRRDGVKIRFWLSLDEADERVQEYVVGPAKELGVLDYFSFIGTVRPTDVSSVISSVDAIILLSQLECFSANITEAWGFGRPLVVSNLEWARAECDDAACYVDRNDPDSVASALEGLALRPDLRDHFVQKGRERLKYFNTHDSRFSQWIEFLGQINELGKRN